MCALRRATGKPLHHWIRIFRMRRREPVSAVFFSCQLLSLHWCRCRGIPQLSVTTAHRHRVWDYVFDCVSTVYLYPLSLARSLSLSHLCKPVQQCRLLGVPTVPHSRPVLTSTAAPPPHAVCLCVYVCAARSGGIKEDGAYF